MVTVKNPILTGFYPDPSICRVGEDFYLVTSSFDMHQVFRCFTAGIWHIGSKSEIFCREKSSLLLGERRFPGESMRRPSDTIRVFII